MGRKICSINSKLTYRNLRRDQRIKERIEEYDFQNAILKISSILEDYLPKRDINNVFIYSLLCSTKKDFKQLALLMFYI